MKNMNAVRLVKIAEIDYNIYWLHVHNICTGAIESVASKPSPEKE